MIAARAATVIAALAADPAAAVDFDLEATTDLRRSGLSWSAGRPMLVGRGSVALREGLSIDAGLAGLRGSPRHGGADLLAEATLRYEHQTGPWRLWGGIHGLGFAGASDQSYAQLRAGTALGIGPLDLSVTADWAPPQRAIGGSNLHVGAYARAGVMGTPLTLTAGVGRSTGSDDGSGRARRLRPCGDYSDFLVEADYVLGAITLGASASTTTINHDCGAADAGTRLLFRAAIGF
jgi:hypothetical protein